MSLHIYPIASLAGDYLRAVLGTAIVLFPVVMVPLPATVEIILLMLAALFIAFGGATLFRQLRPVLVTDAHIEAQGPFPVRLEWSALEFVGLRYYATRRDGVGGWMQLVFRAAGRRLRLDNRIEDFTAIAERTAWAIRRHCISVTPATAANFAALGITIAPEDR